MIGLYVNPPDHAAVFAVDEKTAIQALDRLDPDPAAVAGPRGAARIRGFRHGTLSLLAALDTKSGEVLGQTVPRHTSAAFVEFLGDIVASQPKGREIHVIADTCPHTRRRRCGRSCWIIRTCSSTSRRPIPRGSTRLSFGLPRSNGTCLRAVSSRRWPTSRARFVATSVTTTRRRNRSAGVIAIRRIELVGLQRVQVH